MVTESILKNTKELAINPDAVTSELVSKSMDKAQESYVGAGSYSIKMIVSTGMAWEVYIPGWMDPTFVTSPEYLAELIGVASAITKVDPEDLIVKRWKEL